MTNSKFIKGLLANNEKVDPVLAYMSQISDEVRALTENELPPLSLVQNIGSPAVVDFVWVGISTFEDLIHRFRVRPDWTVFDLGCGCGRLAIPFVRYLKGEGKYYGVDVWPEGIDWCREHLPEGVFHCLKVEDNYYYQEARKGVKNTFNLSFIPDNSVDLIFGISVFTHLVRSDIEIYLKEFKRILAPGRCAYLSCFIIDKYFEEYRKDTGLFTSLVEETPGEFHAFKGQDFFAGYALETLKSMLAEAGLSLVFHELGSWARKPGSRSYQDILIIER
jgi:ubiquinone/menaquinone biosynthesis C-methylase UbiE